MMMTLALTAAAWPIFLSASAWPTVSEETRGAQAKPERLPPNVDISVTSTLAGFERLAPEWLELERIAPGALFFQSVAWARAVFAHERKSSNDCFRPMIVTARRNGRLIAVLPLETVSCQRRCAIVPLGDGFAQYSSIVADPDENLAALVPDMLQTAAGESGCHVVFLRKLAIGSALQRALPHTALPLGQADGAPYVDLTQQPTFESLLKTLKPKTRKNLRNAQNRLERDGEVSHTDVTDPQQRAGLIARTLNGRAARLKDQGLTSRAFSDRGFHDFCALLAEGRDGFPDLMAMSLRHNDRPIAEQWGFVYQGRYYAYVASRDFDMGEASPGKLHLKFVAATAYDRGLKTVDLLAPVMPYKLVWATGVTQIQDFAVPMTAFGSLTTRVYDAWLRPRAKAAIMRVPPHVRAPLTRLMMRA